MRGLRTYRFWVGACAAVVLLWGPAPEARADYLVLVDGRTLVGEVLEETTRSVKFRYSVNGIWTTVTFGRRQIDYYELEEGDQSDRATAKEEQEPEPKPRSTEPEPRSGIVVATITLRGQVGGVVDDAVSGTFDAAVLHSCFEKAANENAQLVILDIHSPGGLVAEMELICDTIVAWHDRLRIVAYPREAYSAAAIIALTCRELAVRPSSRIGAAVIIKKRGDQTSAVDAKFASPHYARQRQYMAASSKPYEVVEAMTIQETELWWSPTEGFTTDEPESASGGGWKRVDGKTTILTMTGAEALEWSVADWSASSARAVVAAAGIEERIELVPLDDVISRYNAALDKRLSALFKQFDTYFKALVTMANGLERFAEEARRGDRRAAAKVRAEIRRAQGTAQISGRKIRKTDRSLLARRVKVADEVIERIQADAELIGRINGLLNRETIEGFNEAADRLNEVVESWRELFGQ